MSNRSDYLSLDRVWKVLLIMVLTIYSAYYASAILIPIIFSAFLAIIINPIVSFLEHKKLSETLSILITIVVLLLLLVLGFFIISSQAKSLVNDIPNLVDKYNNFLDDMEAQLNDVLGFSSKSQIDLIKENSSGIISSGSTILSNAFNATSSLISFLTLVPIYVIFMLFSRKNFSKFLRAIGKRNNTDYLAMGNRVKDMIHSYIGGLLIVISIIAFLNTVGLLALGIKHAIFLGVLSGILTVIPYIGILIGGAIPVIVALLTKDSLFYPLAVIALIAIVQFLEGNFITPKIMGSQVNVSSLATIIALIVGAAIWGIIGMIIAIPMLGITKIILESFDSLKPYAILLSANPADAPPEGSNED